MELDEEIKIFIDRNQTDLIIEYCKETNVSTEMIYADIIVKDFYARVKRAYFENDPLDFEFDADVI